MIDFYDNAKAALDDGSHEEIVGVLNQFCAAIHRVVFEGSDGVRVGVSASAWPSRRVPSSSLRRGCIIYTVYVEILESETRQRYQTSIKVLRASLEGYPVSSCNVVCDTQESLIMELRMSLSDNMVRMQLRGLRALIVSKESE